MRNKNSAGSAGNTLAYSTLGEDTGLDRPVFTALKQTVHNAITMVIMADTGNIHRLSGV